MKCLKSKIPPSSFQKENIYINKKSYHSQYLFIHTYIEYTQYLKNNVCTIQNASLWNVQFHINRFQHNIL